MKRSMSSSKSLNFVCQLKLRDSHEFYSQHLARSLVYGKSRTGRLTYFILPIDLIPELLFGVFGVADDMAALALLFGTVLRVRNRISEKERQKSLPTTR